MGQRLFRETKGNVCGRALEQVAQAYRACSRPYGDQAFVHCAAGRRFVFRLRAESSLCPSGNWPPAQPRGTRLLLRPELRPVSVDARRRYRKARPRRLAGVARRPSFHRILLAPSLRCFERVPARFRQRRTRCADARRRPRALDLGRPARRLAQRRDGFDDHSSLCGESFQLPTKNLFHFVSRAQL